MRFILKFNVKYNIIDKAKRANQEIEIITIHEGATGKNGGVFVRSVHRYKIFLP